MPANHTKHVTAAMLAIGDELLSGRTKDRNIGYLADFLTLKGIDLKEVRIVGDKEQEIVEALNALRARYVYVFTSGGIGPTHDDITADAVAKAFQVSIDHDPRALKLLSEHYAAREIEFTEARKRMARVPQGAELIENPISAAPGFVIGNVHVLAGVPSIFQVMLESIGPALEGGMPVKSIAIDSPFPEGTIGTALAEVQKRHPETVIGSYPRFDGERYNTQIVIRFRDKQCGNAATHDVKTILDTLQLQEQDK